MPVLAEVGISEGDQLISCCFIGVHRLGCRCRIGEIAKGIVARPRIGGERDFRERIIGEEVQCASSAIIPVAIATKLDFRFGLDRANEGKVSKAS